MGRIEVPGRQSGNCQHWEAPRERSLIPDHTFHLQQSQHKSISILDLHNNQHQDWSNSILDLHSHHHLQKDNSLANPKITTYPPKSDFENALQKRLQYWSSQNRKIQNEEEKAHYHLSGPPDIHKKSQTEKDSRTSKDYRALSHW